MIVESFRHELGAEVAAIEAKRTALLGGHGLEHRPRFVADTADDRGHRGLEDPALLRRDGRDRRAEIALVV